MAARIPLELLAPARDADIGIEAVNHGADAVYIGGPGFGARDKAPNEIADIARLVAHAHRFNARIFVTMNTILR
ncbi:peptidase U32 family protein, partial [Serratia marcescens]